MQTAPKITVGVTGGVAAYKAVELVRALQRAGMDPHVVMTAGAEQFVTALTFAAVSGHTVITSLWSGGEVPGREVAGSEVPGGTVPGGNVPGGDVPGGDAGSSVEHIEQAQTTRALVIVPATAHVMAKLAHGLADDFLTTMALATPAPVIVAPSMNVEMWLHPATQANVRTLRERGVQVLGTGEGYLACGMVGAGRLVELDEIVAAVQQAVRAESLRSGSTLQNLPGKTGLAGKTDLAGKTGLTGKTGLAGKTDLTGKTVLVTAGGTREPLDGVRFLGNRSSGRMGYALAAEARRRGARVLLVSAATTLEKPREVELTKVETAAQMHAAVLALLPQTDLVIKAAAVSDFRPVTVAAGKLERGGALTLELAPTADIVAEVVRQRRPGTKVIAFAAEMGLDLVRGRAKMQRKGVDAMVINDVSCEGVGFDSERNAAVMLLSTAAGERVVDMAETTKILLAAQILDEAVAAWFAPAT